MLQTLGLIVDLIPGVLEDVVQEQLQEAVMTHKLPSAAFPGRGQANSAMLLILNQRWTLAGQLLEHARDGGGAHSEPLGQGVAGDALLIRAPQAENGLEVIVDRFRSFCNH